MAKTEECFPALFAPLKAGKRVFKNRIFVAPTHSPLYNDEHGYLSREGMTYYGNFARGGAAGIHLGEVILDRKNSLAHEDHLDLTNEYTLQSLNLFNEYAHTFGALTSVELNHSGHFAIPAFGDGSQPMGPSAMKMPSGAIAREMHEEDMEYVAEIYAKAANMAKRAGCDMVLLHYGHGWLMGGFLSPLINKRTDKYGGSTENMMRFPLMVIKKIREVVGNEMLIEVRICGTEVEPGGCEIDRTIAYVKMMEPYIDLVHITAGNRLYPKTRGVMHPSHFLGQGHNVYLAEAVKKSGVSIPVGALGGISDPEFANRILAEGKADYILMARQLLADPNWPEKARRGQVKEIRPCIRCMRCMDIAGGKMNTAKDNLPEYLLKYPTATRRSECAVNPYHGTAMIKTRLPLSSEQKKVVVVGGGPAGMQAAAELAKQHHQVILLEKQGALGGQMRYAKYVWFKSDVEALRKYLINQMMKYNVEIRLGVDASRAYVESLAPDAVVVAVGAKPWIPPILGIDSKNVYTALDAIGDEEKLGDTVILVGGGMVGCETALHLSALGKKSILVEMGKILAPEAIWTERVDTLDRIERDENISCHVSTRCIEITDAGMKALRNGEEISIFGDSIVLCAGMQALEELRDSFYGSAFDVIPVGDCVKPDCIQTAIAGGLNAALAISKDLDANFAF